MGNKVSLRKKRWMSYDAACLTVKQECPAKSRREYWIWHKEARPVGLPRYPHRVYLKEWTSWGDYLGVENSFEKNESRVYRPFWEAVRWTQAQGWKTTPEFKKAHEEGKVPNDIPRAPEKQYDEWISYRHWLGLDVQDKLEAAKQDTAVVALIQPPSMPGGYIQLVKANHGVAELKEKIQQMVGCRVFKVYKWEDDKVTDMHEIIGLFSKQHEDGMWITGNIHGLLFELDNLLEWAIVN